MTARTRTGTHGSSKVARVLRRGGATLAALALTCVASCGYRPLASHGAASPGGGLHVVPGKRMVPAARAADALAGSVAGRLAEAGELLPGTGYPMLEVELLRVDETGEGLADVQGRPLARGLRITAVGRARVFRGPSAEAALDTGDVSAHVSLAPGTVEAEALVLRERAVVAASQKLGIRLAERVLGLPAPSDEGRGADF
jgi:hypothetical protein